MDCSSNRMAYITKSDQTEVLMTGSVLKFGDIHCFANDLLAMSSEVLNAKSAAFTSQESLSFQTTVLQSCSCYSPTDALTFSPQKKAQEV